MNLAIRDVRRHWARFIGTAMGLGLLLSVVVAMQGVYAGMVDDATVLPRAMNADLWLVQRDTRGPFAERSSLDPSVESRAAVVPGVRSARPYTYQLIQRVHHGATQRIALVGLGWPDDSGKMLRLIRGRELQQSHGEIIVDASLGLKIGESLPLANEVYQVVGLTENVLTTGGDSVAFLSTSDAALVAFDQPPEALLLERRRFLKRLRDTDIGRRQPILEELATDPGFRAPALSSPPVAAIVVQTDAHRFIEVRDTLQTWGDVTVYSQSDQEDFLLRGVIQRARLQIGLFTVILTLTAGVIVMMVIYNLTLEKTHDLAVLKLMGAPRRRLLGFIMQQAWLLGALAYAVTLVMAAFVFPVFPRRVLITESISFFSPIAIMTIVSLSSILGLVHVMHIDPSKALEG